VRGVIYSIIRSIVGGLLTLLFVIIALKIFPNKTLERDKELVDKINLQLKETNEPIKGLEN
jgi:hypothetical protein